jgi:hypothetical protein
VKWCVDWSLRLLSIKDQRKRADKHSKQTQQTTTPSPVMTRI